jgi:hypothetical protein
MRFRSSRFKSWLFLSNVSLQSHEGGPKDVASWKNATSLPAHNPMNKRRCWEVRGVSRKDPQDAKISKKRREVKINFDRQLLSARTKSYNPEIL